jgi:hypothetical protein
MLVCRNKVYECKLTLIFFPSSTKILKEQSFLNENNCDMEIPKKDNMQLET